MNKSLLSLGQRLKLSATKFTQFAIFRETRTSILFWYVLLILFFVIPAIPSSRYRLYKRVDKRVKQEMREEIEEFEELLIESLLESSLETKTPQDRGIKNKKQQINSQIYLLFDEFIDNRVTEDDNFLIAIVDGQFYKSSSRALPKVIAPGSDLMQRWQKLSEEEREEEDVADSNIGSIIYKAIPIRTTGQTLGVFVIAHATHGERKEAIEALELFVEILIFLMVVALVVAWFAAGRVLAPLKKLTNTVKSIDESDLTQRIIDIQGDGELAQLGRTFNAMMNRLETSFITQRNFINDAGHELRTPITIIRGHLELIDNDPQSQQETIDLVIEELDRMNRLIEDLVLLAKSERPDFLRVETIKLASFIEELFSKLQTLGERNWHLENHVSSGRMKGDPQRITQAIINLANNAVQHTTEKSLIVLGAKLDRDKLALWICDMGEGIPANEQQRIFDRFARIRSAPRRSDGSGLGLAIVKTIVEAHHGSINLHSQLGVGSTFTLVFPLQFNQKLFENEANINR